MYGGTSGQGLLGLAVFLVVCGVIIGLALIGSDLVNPITSLGELQQHQAETQQLAAQEAVDIEAHKKLSEAQTQVEIQRLNEELAQQERVHQMEVQRLRAEMQQAERLHQEELRQAQTWAALKMRLVEIGGLILVSGFAISLVVFSFGFSRRLGHLQPCSPQWTQASLRLHTEQLQPRQPPVYESSVGTLAGNTRYGAGDHTHDVYELAKEVAIG